MSDSKQLVKASLVSTPVIAAGVLLAVQFFIAGFIADIFVSAAIFGAGYATCWLGKKGAGQ